MKKHPLADLNADIRDHIDREAQENIERGMSPQEARFAAMRKFGNVTHAQEDALAVWRPVWLDQLRQDIRYALRSIWRAPGFAIVSVATLAIAIGFNTTLYTIVTGMGPTPYVDDPERVVTLRSLDATRRAIGVSYLDFQDWKHGAKSFEGIAAHSGATLNLTDRGIAADRVTGAYISAETFSLLREHPILGRDFRPADDRFEAERVAIIAGSLWKDRYGSDPGIIGRVITVNGNAVTVVGVMREGFRFPLVHDLWQPLATQPGLADQSRDVRRFRVFGRLARGVDLERSRAELSAIAVALSEAHPDTNTNVRPTIESFAEGGFDVTNPWNAMLISVDIVLLIACANIANLLLARAAHRSHEIAIRASLGATRWRIMRQLLAEAGLLAVVAGGVGIGLALLGVRLWLMSMPVANWPYWFHFAVDGDVLTYLGIISGGSAVLFGIGPALHMSKWHPGAQVKHGGRGTTGPRTHRWTNALLVAQFALTLSLLAGAGLLARTLMAVHRADSIVDTSNVILAGVHLPPERYATPEKRITLFSQLEARLSSVPFLEAAVLASGAPFYNAPVWTVRLQGQAPPENVSAPTASYVLIGSRYFDTLRLRLIRGRPFTDLDGTSGRHVAIVNQLFASRHFPSSDPIGQQIQLTDPDTPDATAPWLTIVGVSPTVRQHYAQPIDPVVYVPYRQNPIGGMVLMARATSDLPTVTPILREQLRQLDPDLPLADISTLDWLMSGTQFANRVFATIFGLAAAFALVLAAVGLHAIIAYSVHQRRQEIGVRMALGAQSTEVVWLFVRRVFAPLAWGLAIGLVGAFGVGRFVSSMLIQTSPHDPATLVAISIVLIGVALAAAFRPARLATKVSPIVALRNE